MHAFHLLLSFVAASLASAILYQPALNGPYVFDDVGVLDQQGSSAIDRFPPTISWWRAETRPVVMLSFSAQRVIADSGPRGFRWGNLIIHALAATILGELVRQLVLIAAARWSYPMTGSLAATIAICVAALWLVHPLNTQAVAYIIQRCESLMGLFYFAFLLCVVRHDQTGKRVWLIAGFVCFILGLWSKTIMVTALAVAPLLDRALLQLSWREVFRVRGWLYLPPLAFAALAVATLIPGILRGDANVGFGGDAPPLLPYVAGQADVLFRYLSVSLFPIGLNIDHGLLAPDPWTQNLPQILALLALVMSGCVAAWLDRWLIAFFILAPLLILSPTSSFIPTADLMVEHRMYVPVAILCAALVVIVLAVHGRWIANLAKPVSLRLRPQTWMVACVAPVVLLLSLGTWTRAHDYQSGTALWFDSLLQNPSNPRAAQNLANNAEKELPPGALLKLYEQALPIAQQSGYSTSVVLGRIGEESVKFGLTDQAVEALQKAIQQDPKPASLNDRFYSPSEREELASHRVNLALALGQRGEIEAALKELEIAFQLNDSSPDARAIAGDWAAQANQTPIAIAHFERALQLRPDWPEVESQLSTLQNKSASSP